MAILYETKNRIISNNTEELTKDFLELASQKEEVIIDMRNTEAISSSGLRSFFLLCKTLKLKNLPPLKIINVNEDIKKVFELVALNQVAIVE